MPFQLSEIHSPSDFPEMIAVEFESYENPYSPLIRLFFPIFGDSPEARAASLQESIARQIHLHQSDPSSHWLKVTDPTTGNIVGAANWNLYESNPHATASDVDCTWFSPGEDRDMANLLMSQLLAPRKAYMRKPHVLLSACYVHPQFRRQGIGRMLLDWGLKQADERGLETYIDASSSGAHLYNAYGFIEDKQRSLDPLPARPSQRWWDEVANRQKMLPVQWRPMWRPLLGEFADSTKAPWED